MGLSCGYLAGRVMKKFSLGCIAAFSLLVTLVYMIMAAMIIVLVVKASAPKPAAKIRGIAAANAEKSKPAVTPKAAATFAPAKTTTPSKATIPAVPGRITKTNTPVVTPTQAANTESDDYCNYDDAMRVIDRLDELTKEETKGTATSSPDGSEGLTEAQRLVIIAAFTEKIAELELMSVPECLKPSVELLKTSYVDLRDLFTAQKDRTPSDAIELMARVSADQKLFDEEFARVKKCVPTGCR